MLGEEDLTEVTVTQELDLQHLLELLQTGFFPIKLTSTKSMSPVREEWHVFLHESGELGSCLQKHDVGSTHARRYQRHCQVRSRHY